MYAIGIFKNQQGKEEVEVVPTNWTEGNQCYWPPYNYSRFKTAVENRENPNPHNWTLYDVRILRKYDTLAQAQLNLSRSQYSDLSSDTDNEPHRRNVQPPKRYFESPSPIAPRKKLKTREEQASSNQVLQLPVPTSLLESSENGMTSSLPHSPPQWDSSEVFNILNETGTEVPFIIHGSTETTLIPVSNASTQTTDDILDDGFKKTVISLLKSIAFTQKEHSEQLNKILHSSATTTSVLKPLTLPTIKLPIDCLDSLKSLESELGQNLVTKDALVSTAENHKCIISQAIGLILEKLLSDPIAAQFSWQGQRGNLCFKNFTEINNVIFESLLRNPHIGNAANLKDMGTEIGEHLRRITDREHKRLKKIQNH